MRAVASDPNLLVVREDGSLRLFSLDSASTLLVEVNLPSHLSVRRSLVLLVDILTP